MLPVYKEESLLWEGMVQRPHYEPARSKLKQISRNATMSVDLGQSQAAQLTKRCSA